MKPAISPTPRCGTRCLPARPKRIALSDPICAPEDLPQLIGKFPGRRTPAVFGVISEHCAEVLRPLGFKINCIGYEPELPIQTYNTQGNWKELDLIKRARNEARREGIVIQEEDGGSLRQHRAGPGGHLRQMDQHQENQ